MRQAIRSRGLELRRFESDLALDTYLPMLLKHLRINCVLDVGARVGNYGALLRRHNYKGYILSFEPVEENFRRLQQRTSDDPRWHIYQYALGSRNETTEINVSHGTNYSSLLSPSRYGVQNHPNIIVKQTEVIRIHRLDDIFDKATAHIDNPHVYLKMDTQGWDLEVFHGAKGCLDRVAALQSELSLQAIYEGMPNWIEALSEFEQAGFVISAMFPVTRDENLWLTELDCVMVRNR